MSDKKHWETTSKSNQFSYTAQDRINIVKKFKEGASYEDLREEYGVSKWSVDRWRKNPDYNRISDKKEGYMPLGHVVKGASTLYDSDGNVVMEWIKTNKDTDQVMELLQQAVEAMSEDIPRAKPITKPKGTYEDLCSTYVITDYHFGQLSSKEELGGEGWDMDIAENLLINWFSAAIALAPHSKTAILCQLGDFLHQDGLEALTPASKHILDATERFGPIVKTIVRVLRQVIDMLLEKHEEVHIVMAEGNHDIASSAWLRTLFAALYEKDPRVTVDQTHTPYYGFAWGDTSLFFHHGHKARIGQMSEIMAAEFKEMWGASKYAYAHMGHYHHKDVKESRLMVVEQHPTLAAKDAYSKRGGYHSQRNASVITYSKKWGEVSRVTVSADMVQ